MFGKMVLLYPLVPQKGNSQPLLFTKSSQYSEQSFLVCPWLLSDPCPQPLCAWACLASWFCVLALARDWDSKLQILKGQARLRPSPLPHSREPPGTPCSILSQKSSLRAYAGWLESVVPQEKLKTRFSVLCVHISLPDECCLVGLSSLKSIDSLFQVYSGRGVFSLSAIQEFPTLQHLL